MIKKLLILFSFILIAPLQADEYFGEFKDELAGIFINAEPRPQFKLSSKFEYKDPNGLIWSVPSQKMVDGASIPTAFWSFIGGPFSGSYIKASVIHDYYCDVKIRTEHDTHRNFYYGMRASGVSTWKAKFMYWAVAAFGPKWTLESRVLQNLKCKGYNCRATPEIVIQAVEVQSVDLDDPQVLAAVLSKASSVARTLKTSHGEFLDISANGLVASSFEQIKQSADMYRRLFSDKSYVQHPDKLGVLSKWDVVELNAVQAWDNNNLPVLKNTDLINNDNLQQIEAGQQFKLNENGIDLLNQQLDIKSLVLEMKITK